MPLTDPPRRLFLLAFGAALALAASPAPGDPAQEAVAPGRLRLDLPRLVVDESARLDLDLTAPTPSREAYRRVADAFGLTVVFAPRYEESGVRLEQSGVSARRALDLLATAAGDFWQPVDERTVLVANDTPQARREHEPQGIAAWRLQHLDLRDAATLVRSLVAARDVAMTEASSTLVVRDTVPRLRVVDALLERLDRPEDEVTLDLEVLELPAAARPPGAVGPPTVDAAALREWTATGSATTLLHATLGLVGREPGRFEVKGRRSDDGVAGLEVEVVGRVDRATDDVLLDVHLKLAVVAAGAAQPEGGAGSRIEELRSAWRVGEGRTLLVGLPGGPGHATDGTPLRELWAPPTGDRWLAVALTPRVTRRGSAEEVDAFAVGTETDVRLRGDDL